MMEGYSKLEIMFGQFQWVRRLSAGRWLKLKEPHYSWVKFCGPFQKACEKAGIVFGDCPEKYEYEDWRGMTE